MGNKTLFEITMTPQELKAVQGRNAWTCARARLKRYLSERSDKSTTEYKVLNSYVLDLTTTEGHSDELGHMEWLFADGKETTLSIEG